MILLRPTSHKARRHPVLLTLGVLVALALQWC
jgi:hypothetical protein